MYEDNSFRFYKRRTYFASISINLRCTDGNISSNDGVNKTDFNVVRSAQSIRSLL
jgi:hypothetical protein